MPIDPKHGRTIPSGRDIARTLRTVWHRQMAAVASAIRSGRPAPNLSAWDQTLSELSVPLLTVHYHQGGTAAGRRIRLARARAGKSAGGARVKSLVSIDVSDFDVFRPEVLTAIRQAALSFAASTNATSTARVGEAIDALRRELAGGLAEGESLQRLGRRVRSIFADPERACTIASTEASRAMHAGQMMAAREAGVERKRWLASSDACGRCLALDGVEADIGDPFYVDPRGGPYAVVMHAPLHPNCMCTYVEVG
jgi:hypothetical protein